MSEVIGWKIDWDACSVHGGVGLGVTVYVVDNNNEVHEAWCCQTSEHFDQWLAELERQRVPLGAPS